MKEGRKEGRRKRRKEGSMVKETFSIRTVRSLASYLCFFCLYLCAVVVVVVVGAVVADDDFDSQAIKHGAKHPSKSGSMCERNNWEERGSRSKKGARKKIIQNEFAHSATVGCFCRFFVEMLLFLRGVCASKVHRY